MAKSSSIATQRAARDFTRRTLLKSAALTAIGAASTPFFIRTSSAATGELNILIWPDYLPQSLMDKFEFETGIIINHTPYRTNEDLINTMTDAKGQGFDLCGPTADRAGEWKTLGLLQPFDMNRIKVGQIIPGLLKGSTSAWTYGRGNHHLPYVWGTEALGWRTDKWSRDYRALSYGDLWLPDLKNKVMARPESMMLGIGLFLDRIGQVPSNRMRDAYRGQDNMRRIWGEITKFAIKHKRNLKQFWQSADDQINGFMENDVVLGQTWDGPANLLKTQGKPVTYVAPIEGALAWMDGLSIPIGAKNIDEIYAFMSFIYTPENMAIINNMSGYNPSAVGTEAFLKKEIRQAYVDSFNGDALNKLWWRPASKPWQAAIRAEFRDKFLAA